MMFPEHYTETKGALLYAAYKKCCYHVHRITKEDINMKSSSMLQYAGYDDLGMDYEFCDTATHLLSQISLDYFEDDFKQMIHDIDESMAEAQLSTRIICGFHFGLLLDYLYLFSREEAEAWKIRMGDLFDTFSSVITFNYLEFYRTHFQTQFFGGDDERFIQFTKQMSFTYILAYDWGYDTYSSFHIELMSEIVEFTREYRAFYTDLIHEIQTRKGVVA